MIELKRQITHKLNSIVALIKHCANKTIVLQNTELTKEVMLGVITHETLCALFEKEGPSQNVIDMVNDLGTAIVELYNSIDNYKSVQAPIKIDHFNFKKPTKSMLN